MAERASRRRIVEASSSVGTTFSIEAMTIWMRGRVEVRSPLPSLVRITDVPVSAMSRLAPVMPTSAVRNFSLQHGARLGHEVGDGLSLRVEGERAVRAAEVGLDRLFVEVDDRER